MSADYICISFHYLHFQHWFQAQLRLEFCRQILKLGSLNHIIGWL